MADIIKFPSLKQTRDLPATTGTPTTRPEISGASQQELLAQGGEALAQLGAWKSRGIPDQDRIAMARNMDALLNELCIKPKDLPWQSRYGDDREAFNRDLSRASSFLAWLIVYSMTWRQPPLVQIIGLECIPALGCRTSK
jgi:hypothetical protein